MERDSECKRLTLNINKSSTTALELQGGLGSLGMLRQVKAGMQVPQEITAPMAKLDLVALIHDPFYTY